jgi:hypothetical protein
MNKEFKLACKSGDLDLAKKLKPKIGQENCIDTFFTVCQNGHIDLVKWLMENSHEMTVSQYRRAFGISCEYGHLELCKLLLHKCPDLKLIPCTEFGLEYALKSGYLQIADLMMDNGMLWSKYIVSSKVITNMCEDGDLMALKWLAKNIPPISSINNGLIMACFRKRISVVNFIIESLKHNLTYTSDGFIDFNYVLYCRCEINYNCDSDCDIDYIGYVNFADEIKDILIDKNLINPSILSLSDLKYYLKRTNNVVPPGFTTEYTDLTWRFSGTRTKPALRK